MYAYTQCDDLSTGKKIPNTDQERGGFNSKIQTTRFLPDSAFLQTFNQTSSHPLQQLDHYYLERLYAMGQSAGLIDRNLVVKRRASSDSTMIDHPRSKYVTSTYPDTHQCVSSPEHARLTPQSCTRIAGPLPRPRINEASLMITKTKNWTPTTPPSQPPPHSVHPFNSAQPS